VETARLPSPSYWICIIGPSFAALELLELILDGRRLHRQYALITAIGTVAIAAYILYRILALFRDTLRLRAEFRQELAPETQLATVKELNDLTHRFSRDTFAVGMAVAALRLILGT
jgi:hypothetical protein